jgi:hypothetical protein
MIDTSCLDRVLTEWWLVLVWYRFGLLDGTIEGLMSVIGHCGFDAWLTDLVLVGKPMHRHCVTRHEPHSESYFATASGPALQYSMAQLAMATTFDFSVSQITLLYSCCDTI